MRYLLLVYFSQPEFHVQAWEGERAGEVNRDKIPLSQLRLLVSYRLIPESVLLWRVGRPTEEGAMWQTAREVLDEYVGGTGSPAERAESGSSKGTVHHL